MPDPRVTPDLQHSPIFGLRGQRDRWLYPNERLTPENTLKMRNINLSENGSGVMRGGYDKWSSTQIAGSEAGVGLFQADFRDHGTQQIIVTPTKVYTDNGTTRKTITGSTLSGTANDRCRFVFIDNKIVFTNGVNQVQIWGGNYSSGTVCSDLTGMPWTKCDDLVLHRNFLVALSPTESSVKETTRLRWCDVNTLTFDIDITKWPNNNRYDIYDGGPAIVGGVDNFGTAQGNDGMLLIFKKDGLYPGFLEVDGGFIAFRPLPTRRGFRPIAKHSLIARPEFVFGVATDGAFVVRPDLSVETVTLDNRTEWQTLDQTKLQYAVSWVREKDHQVRTLLSSTGDGADMVMAWDWETGDVFFDVLTDRINYAGQIFDISAEYDWMVGKSSGYVYRGNTDTKTDDGEEYSWEIKWAPNDLGMPGIVKHIVGLTLFYEPTGGNTTVDLTIERDLGSRRPFNKSLSIGTAVKWDDGKLWDDGEYWEGGTTDRARLFVNRSAEVITPYIRGSGDIRIIGYQVTYSTEG